MGRPIRLTEPVSMFDAKWLGRTLTAQFAEEAEVRLRRQKMPAGAEITVANKGTAPVRVTEQVRRKKWRLKPGKGATVKAEPAGTETAVVTVAWLLRDDKAVFEYARGAGWCLKHVLRRDFTQPAFEAGRVMPGDRESDAVRCDRVDRALLDRIAAGGDDIAVQCRTVTDSEWRDCETISQGCYCLDPEMYVRTVNRNLRDAAQRAISFAGSAVRQRHAREDAAAERQNRKNKRAQGLLFDLDISITESQLRPGPYYLLTAVKGRGSKARRGEVAARGHLFRADGKYSGEYWHIVWQPAGGPQFPTIDLELDERTDTLAEAAEAAAAYLRRHWNRETDHICAEGENFIDDTRMGVAVPRRPAAACHEAKVRVHRTEYAGKYRLEARLDGSYCDAGEGELQVKPRSYRIKWQVETEDKPVKMNETYKTALGTPTEDALRRAAWEVRRKLCELGEACRIHDGYEDCRRNPDEPVRVEAVQRWP